MLMALASYSEPHGITAMKTIFQRRGDGIEIPEEVDQAAVRNKSQAFRVMDLLLEYAGEKPANIRKGGRGINDA
ncbi:hypothetical protein N7478_006855 [Penicillium angulare]|uniref:uncharacterized protein n=1 Tax=Penicillium angulare TaxID=116970 RepID=UPI0025409082|nr:uncharacterized protein N7478_006855 [Penicillium angulare]KAJ5281483.1 hypothetical protein N7478_006855 [Penicillium angulare]